MGGTSDSDGITSAINKNRGGGRGGRKGRKGERAVWWTPDGKIEMGSATWKPRNIVARTKKKKKKEEE